MQLEYLILSFHRLTPSLLMAPEESVSGMKRDADVEAG